jgi:hypothetical protein
MNFFQKVENWFIDTFFSVKLQTMPTDPPVVTTQAQPAPVTPLVKFCTSIRNYEGKPGDPNYVNNNPGDFRYYFGGYLPKYGVVKESPGGFAVFETYELGWEYLVASVTEMCDNHPTWNFLDFFNRYAPSSDGNNPELYAQTIAGEMGVDVSAIVKTTLNI